MWTGLLNPKQWACTSKATCSNRVLRFVDGTPFKDESWFDIQVSGEGGKSCQKITDPYNLLTYGIHPSSCFDTLSYFCQFDCNVDLIAPKIDECPVPSGFRNLFGHYYQAAGSKSLGEGDKACEALGAHLPEFHSETEQDALMFFQGTTTVVFFASVETRTISLIFQGSITNPLWVGMSKNTGGTCNSLATCTSHVTWNQDNSALTNEAWNDFDINLDQATVSCIYLTDVDRLRSRNCGSGHLVMCQFTCKPIVDCGSEPAPGDDMLFLSSNGTTERSVARFEML